MSVTTSPPTTAPDAGNALGDNLADAPTSQWALALLIFIGSIFVAIAVGRLLRSVLERAIGSGIGAALTSRLIAYTIVLLGLFYALRQLSVEVGPLIGALGLSGLVLALALQKVVENFVGAIILQTRRPFTVGDTVKIGDDIGVVRDIDARTVVLRGLDGTAIRLPNGNVLNETIVNVTREPLRRSELSVGVAYGTNLEVATTVLVEAVERVQRVRKVPRPLVVLRRFGPSSIDFSVFYWHLSDVPAELATTHDLILAVHQALTGADISIAFPQMVVWPAPDAEGPIYAENYDEVFVDHPIDPRPSVRRRTKPSRRISFRQRGRTK